MEELLSKKQPEGSSDMGHETFAIHHADSLHPLKVTLENVLLFTCVDSGLFLF